MSTHDPLLQKLASSLRDGDAVLSLDVDLGGLVGMTSQPPLVVFSQPDGAEVVRLSASSGSAAKLDAANLARLAAGDSLKSALQAAGAKRLVALSHTQNQALDELCRAIASDGFEIVRIGAAPQTQEDDYMPAEDSAAVAERLRELGYI